MPKRNYTIGSFQAAKEYAEEKREAIVSEYKEIAKKQGSFLFGAFLWGISSGCVLFCASFGIRLGFGI